MYNPSQNLNGTQTSLNQNWEQNQRQRIRTRGKIKSRNSNQIRNEENNIRKVSEEDINSPGKNIQQVKHIFIYFYFLFLFF